MTKKPENLKTLTTEWVNAASVDLDRKSSIEIARIINAEDKKVARAVERALPQIANAIDIIANALKQGGRLIYVGAGTGGRIAALDAAECPPTFGVDPRQVQYVMAGGTKALGAAVEANEDSRELGRSGIAKKRPGNKDVVVGIAASGRTPFTVAAVQYARAHGAATIAVTCNRSSPLAKAADHAIVTEVGPEVLSGSSRMKAGTAQKMVLNMLTTGAMARLGYVYGNLMVNVHVKNFKLRERALTILEQAAGVTRGRAKTLLKSAGNEVPVALVMQQTGVTHAQAKRTLKSAAGNVRQAIELAKSNHLGALTAPVRTRQKNS